MEDSNHPLLATLPPKSDYLTYLTIIEYNLKFDDLPLLNDILQDENLTINIGWDLVTLLVTYLPASEPCLITIANLGNPREVLLKVTEALRSIQFQTAENEDDSIDEGSTSAALKPLRTENNMTEHSGGASPQFQFCVLLSMLSILHQRIKTRYPSRFIATTLQGALSAFSQSDSDHQLMIEAVDHFIRHIWRQGRPALPPRDSAEQIPKASEEPAADDPEANLDPPSQVEQQMVKRLIQSFVTHVTEAYVVAISSMAGSAETTGVGWCRRVFESAFPSKIVPAKSQVDTPANKIGQLVERERGMNVLNVLASEVGLRLDTLLQGSLENQLAIFNSSSNEEEPPKSPTDIPLSQVGSFALLADRIVHHELSNPKAEIPVNINIFPSQLRILQNLIGTDESGGLSTAGSEPLGLIDAALAMGFISVKRNLIGEPESDAEFTQYLQLITLVSANTPEPDLRFYAHYLASTILRTHPSDLVRLGFIRDTLEHCPIEILKTSAVSWIKEETLEAFRTKGVDISEKSESVFATPVALESLGPFLFPDLTQELGANEVLDNWTTFRRNLSFYLASLNFYYLLLSAQDLRKGLQIASFHSNNDIGGSMLGPLREISKVFGNSINGGEISDVEGHQGDEMAKSDLALLNDVLDRIERGVILLNEDLLA